MDPQVVEQARAAYPILQQYTEEILRWVKSGAAFVTDQAPQLVTEIIHWEIANSIFVLSIGLIGLIIGAYFSRYYIKNSEKFLAERRENHFNDLPARAIFATESP